MLKNNFDFAMGEERHLNNVSRGSVSVAQIKTSVKTLLTVLLAIVVGGGGGQISPTSGNILRKSDGPSRLLHLQAKCGVNSVCNLATHFCDAVMNSCASCSDDCHPGRITGDPDAIEDCRQKCRVYYELEKERSQLAVSKSKEDPIRERQGTKSRSEDMQHQLSSKTNDPIMISVKDELYDGLRRFELLKAIETICIAVITLIVFVISISLMLLLRRLGSLSSSLPSYNSLEIDSKLT